MKLFIYCHKDICPRGALFQRVNPVFLALFILAVSMVGPGSVVSVNSALAQQPQKNETSELSPAINVTSLSENITVADSLPNVTGEAKELIEGGLVKKGLELAQRAPSHSQPSYMNFTSMTIEKNSYNLTVVYCDEGDGLVIGGYSIDNISPGEPMSDILVAGNQPLAATKNISGSETTLGPKGVPIQKPATIPVTIEGWMTGIVNKGNSQLETTVTALCLNLNRHEQ